MLDQITITLRSEQDELFPVYIDVADNSLSRKWLASLNNLLGYQYHLEKNYCWFGWPDSRRSVEYICTQINAAITHINSADLGYTINDWFMPYNVVDPSKMYSEEPGPAVVAEHMNMLHRYFEDLQGHSGHMSEYYNRADAVTRWHIRQLNLLCHELESLVLSQRKRNIAPDWQRPSQLMCWLNAPRFVLEEEDYELFGIETINRPTGGVFVGVNKAVGKHHWEVFWDEGRDSRIDELTTSAMRSQTEAAGDFDIEWAQNPATFSWQQLHLQEFREWLIANGFDPNDKSLTIGHPQVGQVDLYRTFRSDNYHWIWRVLEKYQDVYKIETSAAEATYTYRWSDANFADRQIAIIEGSK